jgi:threonine synthase
MQNIKLKCTGCGQKYKLSETKPVYNCENIGTGNINHILEKELNLPLNLSFENIDKTVSNNNPYLAFKEFYFSYYLAEFYDINYNEIINKINRKLKDIGEPEFIFTELKEINFEYASQKIKGLLKNETGNVAGSHKARHLMGNIIYLEVLQQAGIIKEKPELAIYSCGNAAMGASAIAKAAEYKLKVFIPEGVDAKVIEFLNNYEAQIITCPRIKGETGDPCYNKFKDALDQGAVPFSCSGPDNWSNIEGGQTLCQELLLQLKATKKKIDSIVIQVGGGALASSAVKTLEEFYENKVIYEIPKIYTVQTEGGFPLVRSYYLLLKEIAKNNALKCSLEFSKSNCANSADNENSKIVSYIDEFKNEIEKIVNFVLENYSSESIQSIIKNASLNKDLYMWSWETEPHSIAHGILDDITYDWFKIINGMLKSGGIPVVVSENELKFANKFGRELSDINVDHTGTSGFTGLLKLIENGWITEKNTPAVFFTGVVR